MEDDNNKQRKAARREFQENVRALVAFVRKRDARVIAWMEQEEIKKAEHKAAEDSRSGLLRRMLHDKLAGSLSLQNISPLLSIGEMSLYAYAQFVGGMGDPAGTTCHDCTIRRCMGALACIVCMGRSS